MPNINDYISAFVNAQRPERQWARNEYNSHGAQGINQALYTMTPEDYNLYDPDSQNLIRQILRGANLRPDLFNLAGGQRATSAPIFNGNQPYGNTPVTNMERQTGQFGPAGPVGLSDMTSRWVLGSRYDNSQNGNFDLNGGTLNQDGSYTYAPNRSAVNPGQVTEPTDPATGTMDQWVDPTQGATRATPSYQTAPGTSPNLLAMSRNRYPNQVVPQSSIPNGIANPSTGSNGLASQSLGNRPGRRSPVGMTGGAFRRGGPRGYEGY